MEEQKSIKSWTVSDKLWEVAKDLIPEKKRDPNKTYQRKKGGGRKPLDPRRVLSGILYILRNGSLWKALPKEYGASSSVHRYFQYWLKAGFFLMLWQKGLEQYDELEGIAWEWQSIDGAMVKAPLALEAVGPNPTDRGKKWDQAQYIGREQRLASGGDCVRSERPRCKTSGPDIGCDRGGASTSDR